MKVKFIVTAGMKNGEDIAVALIAAKHPKARDTAWALMGADTPDGTEVEIEMSDSNAYYAAAAIYDYYEDQAAKRDTVMGAVPVKIGRVQDTLKNLYSFYKQKEEG